MKNRVLLFAYDFPPRGWSGVQRTVKFVRYMPDFGWDPIVVTTSDWYSSVPSDNSLSHEVAHALTIRTRAFTRGDWSRLACLLWRVLKPFLAKLGKDEAWLAEGLRWRLEALLFFPDEGVTWVPFAIRAGFAAVREYKPTVIYATAPPFSTLISAWIVAKACRVPLVVDLRDLWVDKPDRIIHGRVKKRLDRFLESSVLSGAAGILTTTRSGADLLRNRYPKKGANIFTIYNGYDRNDFDKHAQNRDVKNRTKLVIGHIGSLYGDRSPAPFLKGLAAFLQRQNAGQVELTVRFVGRFSDFDEIFKEYENLGVIRIEEPVEHHTAIEIMHSSDVLLLIVPQGNQKVIYAKLFEYLASGRPILCIAPLNSEMVEVLHMAGNAWFVDIWDVEGIVRCLNEICERWVAGQLVSWINGEAVSRFERKSLTSQLCDIFVSVAAK